MKDSELKELMEDPVALNSFLRKCAKMVLNHQLSIKVINPILPFPSKAESLPQDSGKLNSGKLTSADFPLQEDFDE